MSYKEDYQAATSDADVVAAKDAYNAAVATWNGSKTAENARAMAAAHTKWSWLKRKKLEDMADSAS